MIAALPMYDRAETQADNDALWRAIRAELGHGPDALSREGDLWEIWQSPDLLLAQTCGYPYRARLHNKVQLVGTPDYGLEGCAPGEYYSVFVARKEAEDLHALAGQRFAFNEPLSQSGWAAPRHHMDQLGLSFGPLVQSGGHVFSAQMVAEGGADFAALDAVSWALMQRHDAFAQDLKVVAKTTPTPALPLITSRGQDAEALFAATHRAIANLPAATREALHLHGLVHVPKQAYLAVPTPPAP